MYLSYEITTDGKSRLQKCHSLPRKLVTIGPVWSGEKFGDSLLNQFPNCDEGWCAVVHLQAAVQIGELGDHSPFCSNIVEKPVGIIAGSVICHQNSRKLWFVRCRGFLEQRPEQCVAPES